MKPQVVIVQNTELGGHLALSIYLTGLLSHYSSENFEFNLICARKENDKLPINIDKNFSIFYTGTQLYSIIGNLKFSWKTILYLRKIQKIKSIDIIHALYPNSSLLGSIIFKIIFSWRTMIIYDVRSPWIEMSFANNHISKKRSFLKHLMHITEYILVRFVNIFVFITEGTKEYYIKKYGLNSIEHAIIPSGVNVSIFSKDMTVSQIEKIKQDHAVNLDTIIIGYTGTIAKMRELDKFISLNVENIKTSNVQFVFVGDGDGLSDLKDVFKNHNMEKRAVFLGKKTADEVPMITQIFDYGLCHLPDIFVFQNSFPLKILEYLSAGKRVLCSDIYAHREIAKEFENECTIYKGKIDFTSLNSQKNWKIPAKIYHYDWTTHKQSYEGIYELSKYVK